MTEKMPDVVGDAVSKEVHSKARKLNDGVDALAKALHVTMGCESLTLSATYQILVEDSSKQEPIVQPVTCVGTSAVSTDEWKLHLAALHAVLRRLMDKQAAQEERTKTWSSIDEVDDAAKDEVVPPGDPPDEAN